MVLKTLLWAEFLLVFFCITQAQPGCPAVNAGNNVTLPCTTHCTTLKAVAFESGNTSTYNVSQIPYTPFSYNTGTVVTVPHDDEWSAVINLPFTFCYFGQSYTKVVIGSNGQVSFKTANAGQYNNWDIYGAVPAQSAADGVANCILGPFQDIDLTYKGKMYFDLLGTAPCRILVVSWYECPFYGDPNSIAAGVYCDIKYQETSQIVLYETTNAIDIYIAQKDEECKSAGNGYWNKDEAIEGIVNPAGTVAYTVPGRNATKWAATDDAWRFTPNGASIVQVNWLQGNTVISTDSVVSVCPTEQTTYTARAIYTPCSGVTDDTVTSTVTVSLSGTLGVGTDSVKNTSCNGTSDGAAYAHVTGGTPPVSYAWSDGATTLSITNLAAGTYIFTATDANACQRSDTVVITSPPQLTGAVPDVTQNSCLGYGALQANSAGGTTPYTYTWSNGQHGALDSAIAAGTYMVTITDAHNCSVSGTGTLTINILNTLALGPPVINPGCFNATNGDIIVNATAGAPPYTYTWNNTQTGDTAANLAPGSYSVTVTDAGGCSVTNTYNVPQPAAIVIQDSAVHPPVCYGITDAWISVTAAGGSGALAYSWSNGQTGDTLSGIYDGSYSLTITDAMNCSVSTAFLIVAPDPIRLDYLSIDSVTCYGASTGQISTGAAGGTGELIFSWVEASNGAVFSDSDLTGLPADIYSLTITDADGCTDTSSYEVVQPLPIIIDSVTVTNPTCYGSSNGSAIVYAEGGTTPYSYLWSAGSPGNQVSDSEIPGGAITVVVTDSKGCPMADTVAITQPPQIFIENIQENDVDCFGNQTGSVQVEVTGGTPPLSLQWNNGSTSVFDTSLAAGVYTIVVTDSDFCTASLSDTISQPNSLTLSLDSINARCFDGEDGSAIPVPSGGTPAYKYVWSNGASTDTAGLLSAGTYTCTITDARQCTASASTSISQPTQIYASPTAYPVKCPGQQSGSVFVTDTGGVPPYTYAATQDGVNFIYSDTLIEGLDTGWYQVQVADANGCTLVIKAYVPNALTDADSATGNPTLCYGPDYNDGSIEINVWTDLYPPYQFSLDDGPYQASGDFWDVSAGTHTVVVMNANGCLDTIPVSVGEPLPIIAQIIPDSLQLDAGQGQQVQSAYLNTTDPVFSWTPATGLSCVDCPNPVVNVFEPEIYTLTVSKVNDSATCYGSATLYVDINPHPPIYVPNVFSPNGDGKNDLFQVYGNNIMTVNMKIFNRWGELVYETNNQLAGWDGTYKGQMQNPGVFIYDLKVTFLDNTQIEKNGSVTLLR